MFLHKRRESSEFKSDLRNSSEVTRVKHESSHSRVTDCLTVVLCIGIDIITTARETRALKIPESEALLFV